VQIVLFPYMKIFVSYLLMSFFTFLCVSVYAQKEQKKDTFFLLKKKGLLKRLGESIYREDEVENVVIAPVKVAVPFLEYEGKRIRFISIAPTGFYTIVHDTVNGNKKNFLENVGDFFHKNTLPKCIKNNLFFKGGDRIIALKLSDNEQFLRSQPFLQDARIVVEGDSASPYVDIKILTRDVFSIGGSLEINSKTKGELAVRDENLFGTGNRLEITSLYDKDRMPAYGIAASYLKRNIAHTFINWTTGFNTYTRAFNSGQQAETNIYTAFSKPFVSRYTAWTGAAYISYNKNTNVFNDSTFNDALNYQYLTTDFWGGFNIGYKNKNGLSSENRLRHFVAIRTFYNNFFTVPNAVKGIDNPTYVNLNGFLASYSLYKQNFYRTNFIYGFGRNEDVPEGINATLVAGFTNKQGLRRPYYGVEFDRTHLDKKGNFTTYTFRSGGYIKNSDWEDANFLIGVNRFTKLVRLNAHWRNRNFITLNYARQVNTTPLSGSLNLTSGYGLPYFNAVNYGADTRTTIKIESVFFNLRKLLGFRFAPFVYSDISILKPLNEPTSKSNGYTSIGGGIRARNENLVFGTVELKGYYFPRLTDGMKNWRVEFTSKLSFNFNSAFIRRPEFVSPN
jgi:hypothetical protein